jgi:hypothetical protein
MKELVMKASIVCAAFLAAPLAIHAVLAADDNDRPAGVEAQHWLPISDRLGFVVMAEKDRIIPGSRQVLLADPERVSAADAAQEGVLCDQDESGVAARCSCGSVRRGWLDFAVSLFKRRRVDHA